MIYRFADHVLDANQYRLTRDGAEVHVEPQVFDVLVLLAESNGALVSYDDLIATVWKGRIVSDATMASRISAARAAVGDTGKDQAIIKTLPRRGVQLVVPVEVDEPTAPAEAAASVRYGPIRMISAADGTALAWSSIGDGQPPLLRTGHWLTHLELDRQSPVQGPAVERLALGRRVILYDPRGTGLSDRDCAPVTIDDFVRDMEDVLDAAGAPCVDVYASSQAAAVSCLFAAAFPDRVRRMVFYGGFAEGPEVRAGGADKGVAEATIQMIAQGWGKPGNAFMQAFSTLFVPGATAEDMRDFVRRQEASATPERAAEYRRVIGQIDVKEVLPRVACPVLVAHAKDDALHPFSQAKLFSQLLPNAQMMMTESNNHILLPHEPAFEPFMQAVEAFLSAPD